MVLYHIYCIWVKTEQGVLRYYGHTTNMRVRKDKHVAKHKKWVAVGRPEKLCEVNGATRSVYVLEHADWRMDPVDEVEHEDEKKAKDKARAKEGEWILKHECMNMHVAGRTTQESRRQYNKTHKEEIKAKAAEKVTCEVCGTVVRKDGIARHRNKSKKHQNALNALNSSDSNINTNQ